MSDLGILQILFLTIYSGVAQVDALSFGFGLNGIIQTGVVTGLVVGRPELGLLVGGTLQSYALGIGTYGGASIPNWTSAAMLVTALGTSIDQAESLITLIGVPLAALGVQFDVIGRMSNTLFQRRADVYVEAGDLAGIARMNLMGTLPWSLSRAIPMFVALSVGPAAVTGITTFIADYVPWLTGGFAVAGRILPGIGFAILLKYLPVKRHFTWLIVGFVLAAYLNMSVLGISLIGLGAALIVYRNNLEAQNVVATGGASVEFGGDDEYDE
ncbi:MAG: PTS sugar transporter subunit IIC [Erysipelothrix sp.]|nr:PTS sugar transporter subunit IIC [Erysipelothrix sp.]